MGGLKVFISHKNEGLSNFAGALLREAIQEAGYEVFYDKYSLEGGMQWEQQIYDELRQSDVLILLVEESTVESDWVQREIDIARALYVSVLPVVLGNEYGTVEDAFERFRLGGVQIMKFRSDESEDDIEDIIERISPLARLTQTQQKAAWKRWYQRRGRGVPPRLKERTAQHRFIHAEVPGVIFQIATGDATQLRGYHVLVNSENTYMQMARYFERHTLSRQVRLRGAWVQGGSVQKDSLQEELFNQVHCSPEYHAFPINEKQVVITSPGHLRGKLAEVGYRFVLHAAAVDLTDSEEEPRIRPLKPIDNVDIIANCFERLIEIEKHQGAVLYDENKQRFAPKTEPSPYESIRSVVFPVFGTGQGENPYEDAVSAILKGFVRHAPPARERGMSVDTIGLCVYDSNDVEQVLHLFEEQGFREVSGDAH